MKAAGKARVKSVDGARGFGRKFFFRPVNQPVRSADHTRSQRPSGHQDDKREHSLLKRPSGAATSMVSSAKSMGPKTDFRAGNRPGVHGDFVSPDRKARSTHRWRRRYKCRVAKIFGYFATHDVNVGFRPTRGRAQIIRETDKLYGDPFAPLEKLFRSAMETSPHRDVRGWASLALGHYLVRVKEKAERDSRQYSMDSTEMMKASSSVLCVS